MSNMNLKTMKDKLGEACFNGKTNSFIRKNAASLSTTGAVISLIIALVSAFKASDKVADIHRDFLEKVDKVESSGLSEPEKAKEIKELKLIRNIQYVKAETVPIIAGAVSGGLSIASNVINGATIAGLTAFAFSQKDKLQNIAEHAKELIGEEKFKEIEDQSLEDLVVRNFLNDSGDPKTVTMRAIRPDGVTGMEGYLDTETGAIFLSKEEDLKDAFLWAEKEVARNHMLTYSKWCEHCGFPEVKDEPINKVRAWTPANPFKAHIGNRTTFGITLKSIEYENKPQPIEKKGSSKSKSGVPWKA